MAVSVDDKIRKLSTAQRKKVEARAVELIAEEMTLRHLATINYPLSVLGDRL